MRQLRRARLRWEQLKIDLSELGFSVELSVSWPLASSSIYDVESSLREKQ
jgi:hypothetical protein